jgi:UDP-4-amino-4,6-dideoxy-N-acetyl-beta-L-altrosamine transaminase
LWTSPNTFVASANCAGFCGATVDFVDSDPASYNLSVDQLADKLARAAQQGMLPKVVVPVHFAGQSCDMESISRLCKQQNITVIEDACHAIGGNYRDTKIGSCRYSDMAVFSFHAVKIITTGEGGMIMTNSGELYQKLLRLRTHGITRDDQFMNGPSEGAWYYQQVDLGFNYRITDIQAALGTSQLVRIDEFVIRRRELALRYTAALTGLPLILPQERPDCRSAYHMYVIRLQMNRISRSRREVFDALREKGIGVNVHYIPVHTHPYYQKLGFGPGDYPEAEQYYAETITLPLYPTLSDADQDYIVAVVREALS